MELSIQRSTAGALVIVALIGGYAWFARGGSKGVPDVPELPGRGRALEAKPGARSEPEAAPAPRADMPRAEAREAPVVVEEAAAGSPDAAVKRERTADEKARSLIAVAEGYADNGRYDLAFEKLEAADALGPSDGVRAELRAATDAVTAKMRAARR